MHHDLCLPSSPSVVCKMTAWKDVKAKQVIFVSTFHNNPTLAKRG